MKKIAVFASGSGSNFQALYEAVESGLLHVDLSLLVCDRPGAYVEERARMAGVRVLSLRPKDFLNKALYEKEILKQLLALDIEFIILAGYMRLIGQTLLEQYEGRIVNIHPSLLPDFPGKDAIGQAYAAGVKVSGVTVHFVDAGMDTGEVIAQQKVPILPEDTRETLQAKIQRVEHQLYPAVVEQLLNGEKEAAL